MGADLSTLFAIVQTYIAMIQLQLDQQAGRQLTTELERERLLRRRGIDVGHTIRTPPVEGALSLSLAHNGRDQSASPYVIVGGGLLIAVPGTREPLRLDAGEMRIVVDPDEPVVLYAPPAWPPRVPFVTDSEEPATLRRILDQVRGLEESMFTLTSWVEELDGSVFQGHTGGYRLTETWYENVSMSE